MYKDREARLFQGPLWDLNLTFGVGCCHDNRNTSGWQFDVNVGDVFFTQGEREWNRRMFMDADWSQLLIDRWHEARQDVLDFTNLFARIDAHADPLIEAQSHNFSKFPDVLTDADPGFPSPVSETWREQIDFIKESWLRPRITWIDNQFVPAPRISHGGADVEGAMDVSFALPPSGVLYYTLDGSDPRAPGGGISEKAILYSGGNVRVSDATPIMARVFDASVNPRGTGLIHTHWSAPTVFADLFQFPAQAGDANRDREFDAQDIVQVSDAGKYGTGAAAAWEEGDWNEDGVFNQLDIVAALQTGNYLQGPYAAGDARE
jgi:hypothetical protein